MIVGNYPIGIGGDFIVAIDGKPVEDGNEFADESAMSRKRGGDWMDLTVYRNGRKEQTEGETRLSAPAALKLELQWRWAA